MSRRLVLERGVHVAVLWALAVAGPLFDTLGGNPEFFAVRAASPGEIVAFALLVTFVPPLALLAAEWLVGLVSEAAAWALHVVFVAALSAAVVLGVLSLGTAPALALALVAGIAAAIVYVRFPPARTLLTVLGPAPLAFVALFLLVSDASDLVFPASADVQAVHVSLERPGRARDLRRVPRPLADGTRRPHRRQALPELRPARPRRDLVPRHRLRRPGHALCRPGHPRRAPARAGSACRSRPITRATCSACSPAAATSCT